MIKLKKVFILNNVTKKLLQIFLFIYSSLKIIMIRINSLITIVLRTLHKKYVILETLSATLIFSINQSLNKIHFMTLTSVAKGSHSV